MASKQPFKLIDVSNKLKVWSLRFQKFVKHRILSKRRNALLVGHHPNQTFAEKLKLQLSKTWDIFEYYGSIPQSQNTFETLKEKEDQFKSRQYDAIIVLPQKNDSELYDFQDEKFATNFHNFKMKYIHNILAYRLAHKYLTVSGVIILSACQNDFLKTETPYVEIPRLTGMKGILETQVSYLGVTIGDRDYTDLNSWSVIGLSQELVNTEKQDYIVEMYSEWADGKQLPMPGSFAMFKMQQKGKLGPYVQYL